MLRLAARFAVSGGRESVVRLLLTSLGVGIGTTLLLLAAAADPAVRAHQQAQAWQLTGQQDTDLAGTGDPLLWRLDEDGVDGKDVVVLRVAATGPAAPIPVGLDHVPAPGEVAASPALADLIAGLPPDQLADRFPAAPSATIGEDHLAGPEELVAVVGVSVADLDGQPGVLEVHHIRTEAATFAFPDLLRIVFGIGAVGLLLPVVVFVSTSTRLGAARREQRFAALRLAGATPGQTNLVAAMEAVAAAVAGVAIGVVGFLLLRSEIAKIDIDAQPSFVDDVRIAPGVLAAILIGVPVLSIVAAMVSLRRLNVSPLGVARRARRPRPTVRRLAPLVVGGVGFVGALASAGSGTASFVELLAIMGTFALMIYGIAIAGPWLTVLTARAIVRVGRRPSALLAGRRLEDDPATGFRAVSGLVLAVFVASVFSGVSPALRADTTSTGQGLLDSSSIAAFLPLGTTTDAARVALDDASAAGADRGALLHSDPARPSRSPSRGATAGPLLVACADVDLLAADVPCPAGDAVAVIPADTLRAEPTTWTAAEIGALPVGVIVVATDGRPATTDRVRTALTRALPGTTTALGSEIDARRNSRLTQLDHLADVALMASLLVAGCSLAVAVAGGIVERKRPFALLRLSGMHLRELQRVALLEATAPLLLIALASALLGLAVSAVIVPLAADAPWAPPTIGYWASLAGGLGLAVGVAAAALPLLGPTTTPSAVRFE